MNPEVLEVYQFAKSIKKTVALVGQTPYPLETVNQILKRFNISQKNVFLSSEANMSAKTGDLQAYAM